MRAGIAGFSLIELMLTVGVAGVVAAVAIPMMGSTIGSLRLDGDARSLTNAVSVTKLRAAASFSKARLYVDLTADGFRVETWQKSSASWVSEGGVTYLSSAEEAFSFGAVGSPPPDTQAVIAQAPSCLQADGSAIGNTACIVFNSRGIPVTDAAGTTGGPTNAGALYITDGTAVFGITVAATGSIQLWRTNPGATPSWSLQ